MFFTVEEFVSLSLALTLYFCVIVWAFVKNRDKIRNKKYYYKDESEEFYYEKE